MRLSGAFRWAVGVPLLAAAVVLGCCTDVWTELSLNTAFAQERSAPELDGAIGWLNSNPLSQRSLRGKVVLIDFWTYTCINSLRPLPYVKSWADKYKDSGLVVVGVHTPEFSFEKDPKNVEVALGELKIGYPNAIDSNYSIWRAFHNEAWPAQYLIDAKGHIRYQHEGEGDYAGMEHTIQNLLKENGAANVDGGAVNDSGTGVEAAPDFDNERSPETYVGYAQSERFSSPERVAHDATRTYSAPRNPSLNEWGLAGSWKVNGEAAVLQYAPGKVIYRFHSRDLHLVLAPAMDGRQVRFRVTLDGHPLGEDAGSDTSQDGTGVVREPRLYQLIRQKGPVHDRTFEIEFLDPGIQVLDFTFG